MATTLKRSTRPFAFKFDNGTDLRQVTVIATDATPDRMGDIVEPSGARLANFRKNPVVLDQHDPLKAIGAVPLITQYPDKITARIQFPPAGVSARSDEVLGLIRAGVLSAVSIGFMPLKWEPLRGGGMRFTEWELYELSIVSIPANPSALVTERSFDDDGTDARMANALVLQRRLNHPPRPAEPVSTPMAQLIGAANTSTCAGREAHARRLSEQQAKEMGGKLVDPRLTAAEARFRLLRW